MTTGPTDVKVTTAAGGPDGMPLALRLSEGLGAHVQPTNTELRLAMHSARDENEGSRHHDDAALQALWLMRTLRTTWFDSSELALRTEIDEFLTGAWITNSQHRLCTHYGATPFGIGNGRVLATWADDRRVSFCITTPLNELQAMLSAKCSDVMMDLMATACAPNVVAKWATPEKD